jgi:hypothetical protein
MWFLPPHGDIHHRILEVSRMIEANPDSLDLYLIRGELYILHEEPDSACADFQYCRSHQFITSRVFLGLSKCGAFAGDSALYFVDQALASEPDMFGALEWKARLLRLQQNFCAAVPVYDQIIRSVPHPSPGLFIDACTAWNECAGSAGSPGGIAALQAGVSRLGHNTVLLKALVFQYQHNGDFENALSIQNKLVEHAAMKSKPLMVRSAIYLGLGNKKAAQDDLILALTAMDQLPPHRSGTPAMKAIRENILSLLNNLHR